MLESALTLVLISKEHTVHVRVLLLKQKTVFISLLPSIEVQLHGSPF